MKALIPVFLILITAGCGNQNSKQEIAALEAKNRQLIEEIKKLNEKTAKIEDIEKRLKNIDSNSYYGIDAVVGPKGSKSQLLLSSVFFNGPSIGLVSGEELKEFQTGTFRRYVTYAIPIAVGDNFKDFQIVGTTHEFFHLEYLPKKKHTIHKPGRLFNSDAQEAVIGSRAAIQLGLELGDIFQPCHGLKDNPHMKHDVDYVVVGILKPSNTPADKVIWIPIKGVQNMPGHDPGKAQHVSAIYLKMHEKYPLSFLSQNVNKNSQSIQIVPSKTKVILDEFNDLKEGLNLLKAALKPTPNKE